MKIIPNLTLFNLPTKGITFHTSKDSIIATAGPMRNSAGLPTVGVTLSFVNNLIASLKG